MSAPVHHAIDYVEIYVTDMEAAKAFYTAAFGWKLTEYGPGYTGIQRHGGGESGGLCLEPEPRPAGSLVILYSHELDASLASVRAAGGEIIKEPFDFPGGRRFEFTDPSGNALAVWTHAAG